MNGDGSNKIWSNFHYTLLYLWGLNIHLGMGQYLLIPFLVGWTSIYQLFWCSPGVQGFDTLPFDHLQASLVWTGYWLGFTPKIIPTLQDIRVWCSTLGHFGSQTLFFYGQEKWLQSWRCDWGTQRKWIVNGGRPQLYDYRQFIQKSYRENESLEQGSRFTWMCTPMYWYIYIIYTWFYIILHNITQYYIQNYTYTIIYIEGIPNMCCSKHVRQTQLLLATSWQGERS